MKKNRVKSPLSEYSSYSTIPFVNHHIYDQVDTPDNHMSRYF